MSQATAAAGEPEHPSPHRHKASVARLLFGLLAPPLAWLIAQLACSTLAQQACYGGARPRLEPAIGWLQPALLATLFACMAICAAAAWVAFISWRSVRGEHRGGDQTLIDIGEGRSRFMAFAGLLTSLGFALAAVFSVFALLLVPTC